jgi:rubrerythrin
MENEKALEILKSAILMEIRGQAFYNNVATQTKDEDIRNLFTIMANEEKLHQEFLSKHYSALKADGLKGKINLPAETDEHVANLILSPEVKNKISAAGFEASAIGASIDMETKAVEIYTDFANKSTEPAIQELFMWLANWEKGHIKILTQIDDELKEKIWYDNQFWPF